MVGMHILNEDISSDLGFLVRAHGDEIPYATPTWEFVLVTVVALAVVSTDTQIITLKAINALPIFAGWFDAEALPGVNNGVAVSGEAILPTLFRLTSNKDDPVLHALERTSYEITLPFGRVPTHKARGFSTSTASGR